jgi:methionyl-tRNA formyltransferase
MRVLYLGDPRGALALLDRGVTLCGVVHGRRGGPGWRRLLTRLRDEHPGVPRWLRPDLSAPEVVSALAATAPTLLASGFYPRVIPPAALALAPGYNVHPSDLPRWRGPDPSYWVIRSGESTTAICVHALTERLDEGDIARRVEVPVRWWESGGALAARLEREAAEVLGAFIAELAGGLAPTLTPQRGAPTWAPLVDPDDVEIDWSWSALDVSCLVRAASPQPGAFSGIGSELMVVLRGLPVEDERFAQVPAGSPVLLDGECYIRCGGARDAYRLDRVRVGRREMTGRELGALLG